MAGSGTGTTKPGIEDKILTAAKESEQIAQIFSPAVAEAIDAGVTVEPVVKGLIQLIAGLFHHHTNVHPK